MMCASLLYRNDAMKIVLVADLENGSESDASSDASLRSEMEPLLQTISGHLLCNFDATSHMFKRIFVL